MGRPGKSIKISIRGRSPKPHPLKVVGVCICGEAFDVFTAAYAHSHQLVKHFECPPCEDTNRRIVQAIARYLEATPVGLLLLRCST